MGHVTRTALRRRRSLGRAAAYGFGRGLLSGLAATAAMSTVMLVAQRAGLLGQMPPRKITERFEKIERVEEALKAGDVAAAAKDARIYEVMALAGE